MPDAPFKRPHHRLIAGILERLDGEFLADAQCFFGGGTCLALQLGEYRESRDIDFLCSSREGFRKVREAVRVDSLGPIARKPIPLAREVRADRDGIRTFVAAGGTRVKFEIILEARLDLAGTPSRRLGVPVLTPALQAAEKILANADRGDDDATFARDVIDLAFFAARHRASRPALEEGLALAGKAYGRAAAASLERVTTMLRTRRGRLAECARALGVGDLPVLKRGLAIVRSVASRS